jgi:hypothetical protein
MISEMSGVPREAVWARRAAEAGAKVRGYEGEGTRRLS